MEELYLLHTSKLNFHIKNKRNMYSFVNYCEITPSSPKERIRVTDDFVSADMYYKSASLTFQSEEPLILNQ